MAGSNPWFTIGVTNSSDQGMQSFLQSLSGSMASGLNGGGGGAGGQTYAQQGAGQSNQPADAAAGTTAPKQPPLFPTKTSKTDKKYKDPRMKAPSWMGGSNLFDDDSHGANVIGQLAARPGMTPAPTPVPAPGKPPGGSSGGGGHHGGKPSHGGGYGYGHLGPIGRAIAGRFGRWW
jgi:hypothetical protein